MAETLEQLPQEERLPTFEVELLPRVPLRGLERGQRIDVVLAVRERNSRMTRSGKPYLQLKLGDARDTIEAKAWEDAERYFEMAEPGSAVRVFAEYEIEDRWGPSLRIIKMARALEGQFEPAALTPSSPVPIAELEAGFRELIASVREPGLSRLLDRFFAPGSARWQRFSTAPAAKVFHQAYVHGLLEHTLSVAQAVGAAARFFPGINRDLALTGAMLHDIGKLESFNRDPMAIEYTDAGRLEGEIPLGYYAVRREIEDIPELDPGLARCLLHIILSHHGSLAHGSPVTPSIREAVLVHQIDNLGGKLGSFDRLERDLSDGESWSRYDRAVEGAAYFGHQGFTPP